MSPDRSDAKSGGGEHHLQRLQSRAQLPPCVDHFSCVDHLCLTTVAVGGDAFARHLTEHRASALGNPATEAHKITKVRYVPGARSSGWNTALKMPCRWRLPIGCRSASGSPRPVSPRPMTFPRGARWWSERQDNPEAVQPRVLPVGCRNHLGYAVSGIHRSGVAAGRGRRAGLTGWYSGGEDEGKNGEYRQDRK